MIQLNFLNARVKDDGYGIKVNGKMLEDIISVALGTIKELPNNSYENTVKSGKVFSSDLCNVSVTIDDRSREISETILISGREVELEEFLERKSNEYSKKAE